MKFICDKDKLLSAVNISLKAINAKTTMPILNSILITCKEEGLTLTSSDLELSIITAPIEGTLIEEGSIALGARIFSEIIRKLPDGDLTIETNNRFVTLIKCGNTEFKIIGLSSEDYPLLPNIVKNEFFSINQAVFKSMIRQTIFSVSLDEYKPIFTGELLEVKNSILNMVSLDGFRISLRNEELIKSTDDVKSVIPAKTMSELSKILSDEDTNLDIYFTEKHAVFELGSCTVQTRLLEGEFFNYRSSFSGEFETKIEIDRVEFLQCVERVSLISGTEKKNPIKLQIKDGSIIITSNTEIGNAIDQLDIDCEGNNIEINFNPRYIIDVLRAISEDKISMMFNSPVMPCIIEPANYKKSKYLILPLRLNN